MSKILEEEIYGKVATPKRKILGEFIEKYVILSLIPFTIYHIGIYIITDIGSKAMQEEQFSINSILNYYNIAILIKTIIQQKCPSEFRRAFL